MNIKRIIFLFITILIIITVMLSAVSCDFIKFVDDTDTMSFNLTEPESEPSDMFETADGIVTSKPTIDTAEEKEKILAINPKFNDYLQINKDIVGYIKIANTIIDYPIVFNGDNDYYLNHNLYEQEDKYGAVFMDMTNHGAILSKNTLIHGHNFGDGRLFADLEKFKQKDFFDNNKTIIFNNLYSDMEWEVFAVYVVYVDDYFLQSSFESDEEFFKFIQKTKEISIFWRDYTPSADDYILSLHTCSFEYDNAHTVINAKLVKKVDNWED